MIVLNNILKISLIVLAVSFFLSLIMLKNLPSIDQIDDTLYTDPIQKDLISNQTISQSEGETSYTIENKYSYELWGLVVSDNDNEKWYSRYKDTDPLNTKDICVVWGENLNNELYKNFRFKSEEYVCYAYPDNQQASKDFSATHLSNNHLLPADSDIYHKIREAGVGDQIHLTGYLSSYFATTADGQTYSRGTSITRDDSGNGACETIYVEDFEILNQGNLSIKLINNISKYLSIIVLIYFIIIALIPIKKKSNQSEVKKPIRKIAMPEKVKENNIELDDLLPPRREE